MAEVYIAQIARGQLFLLYCPFIATQDW